MNRSSGIDKSKRIRICPPSICVLASLIFAFAVSTGGQSPAEGNLFNSGKVIERQFHLGEVHKYEIQAEADEYFKIVLDQGSRDLRLKIFAPELTSMRSVDMRMRGTEQAFWISGIAGSYSVEVSSRRRCDPISKSDCSGIYRLQLADRRSPSPVDRIRNSAQLLSIEERSLGPSFALTEHKRNERIAKLKELRGLWSAASEPIQEALTVEALAAESGMQRNVQEMIKLAAEAVLLWRAAADHIGESEALISLGRGFLNKGELQNALSHYNQALTIATLHNDKVGELNLFFTLGAFFSSINEPRMALYFYNKTLERSPDGNVGGLSVAALAYEKLGDNVKAEELRRLALAQLKNAGYADDDKVLLLSLSRIYGELGEYELQSEVDEREIELARKQNNKFEETITVGGAANTYFRSGKYAKAIEYYRLALSMLTQFDRDDLTVMYLEGLGDTYSASGNFKEALAIYLEAYSRKAAVSPPHIRAAIAHRIAKAYRQLGDNNRARSFAEEAVSTVESVRASLMNPTMRRSYSTSKQDYYEFYIDLLSQLQKQHPRSGYDSLAFNVNEKARARSLVESLTRADVEIKKGITKDLLDREYAARLGVNAAAERQSRIRSSKHTPEQVAEAEKNLNEAVAHAADVAEKIRTQSAAYAAVTQPQSLTIAEIQDKLLDEQTILLEYALGDERSYLWAVSSTKSESFQLPKRADVEVLAKRLHVLLGVGKRWSEDDKVREEYDQVAGQLSSILLGPVEKMIRAKRVVIVADGLLTYIPFSALPSPFQSPRSAKPQPLAMTNEVVSLPSASVLSVLRREALNRKQKVEGIAVVADPVFSESDERISKNGASPKATEPLANLNRMALERAFSFNSEDNKPFEVPRLPFTRFEANSIFAWAPKKTSIKALDFDADREKVLKTDLSKYRIIHFATHGILHSEHPELSGIVLSLVNEKGEPVNGFLRLNEIYNMNLNADLVVLSACQTALGKEVRGEGLIGLTRGFMYAGSPRVVASLWKVDDVATAELMKIFYQKMLKEKMRPAAALRAAKIAMYKTKRWNAPYYWAAFELQGEWR